MVIVPFVVLGGVVSLMILCWVVCGGVGGTFVKGCERMWVAKSFGERCL